MTKGKVLIDGDIIAYRASFSAQDGWPEEATKKADDLVEYIWEKAIDIPFPSDNDYHVYMTGKTNFRTAIGKSAPYKGNRKGEKPLHIDTVREHMLDKYPSTLSDGEEADDLIAIEATNLGPDTVIASIDKDFMQVPCWFYNFLKDEWHKTDEWDGLKFFYTQVLTGDAVDNIIGLYRVGPVKAKKMLAECKTEEELYKACVDAYEGDTDRVIENARLLWLRRYVDQLWSPPI
jgi:5'-3' exonuclease